jgi:hypothetical protein
VTDNLSDEQIAAEFYQAVNDWSNRTERSQQSADFKIGVSDLGLCSEKVRRKLLRQSEPERDAWTAFLGTWVGEGVEIAIKKRFPDVIIQSEVTVEMEIDVSGNHFSLKIPGHPDVIWPEQGLLIDNKGAFGFAKVKRYGMNDTQKRFQRHLYGHAAFHAGMFGDLAYDQIRVGNMWHDRSGGEKSFYVQTEPLDEGVVEEAKAWLEEVVYNYLQGTEAPKEPGREFCQGYCGFYDDCRALDTDVSGMIEDPDLLDAVELVLESKELDRQAKALKAEGEYLLKGVRGSTGTHFVRWVDVGPSVIREGMRAGYSRLQISRVPKPKS